MINLQDVILYLFLAMFFLGGIWSLVYPQKVISFRSKLTFGLSWTSGGCFYRTPFRVRATGLALILITAFLFFLEVSSKTGV
jgi:hypothetical protein